MPGSINTFYINKQCRGNYNWDLLFPFAGVIITDWYSGENSENQRCKLNIFIKGVDLKTDNLKVNSFCQILSNNGNWVDQKVSNENNIKLENAILNQAKKIKLLQS